MRPRRLAICVLACSLAALLVAGCDSGRPEGVAREGLYEDVAGLDYNVFITRELNLRDAEDRDYYRGPEAPPGSALYGVFIQVCNNGEGMKFPDVEFAIEDNQGNEFHPLPLPRRNVFAYRARRLATDSCIPEPGSAAASGPTAGSLLLFKLTLSSLENRPLELVIEAPPGSEKPTRKVIQLDI
ncbi:MAG TPA: hypothetical protein VJT75_13815 [Thermoleophilaceae bacterium]|nr:hypothetical protein [Thermoleophilaceae bacterium]